MTLATADDNAPARRPATGRLTRRLRAGMAGAAAMTSSPPSAAPAVSAQTATRLKLALERREDAALVDALVERAFGPGRLAKTAERLREGNRARADLNWTVWRRGELLGAVRCWPLAVGEAQPRPAVFLGPIAVEWESRKRGLGVLLVGRACLAAADAGDALMLLVGDPAFFGPLGFQPVPPGRVTLPGPVDGRRVLWRALRPGAADAVEGLAHVPVLPSGARLKRSAP